MIGSVTIYHHEIDWIVVGGESGPKDKIRKMELDWVQDIWERTRVNGTSLFYKQGGTLNKCEGHTIATNHPFEKKQMFCKGNKGCRRFNGRLWEEYPE